MTHNHAIGSKVSFILGGGPNVGAVRPAKVIAHWSGDPVASALKVGKSVEEFEATDGNRLTLEIDTEDLDTHPRLVRHVEHDPSGQRPGTWH